MSAVFTRRALTASMIQLQITSQDSDANYKAFSQSVGLVGGSDTIRQTIARAQSCATNDSLPFARLKQIGYGTIVEDVPMFTEGSGNLSVIETIDVPSLYRLGISDFIGYLKSCSRRPLAITISASCNILNGGTGFANNVSNDGKIVDILENLKFTQVSRNIDVGQQIVINSAAFIFIRAIQDPWQVVLNAQTAAA